MRKSIARVRDFLGQVLLISVADPLCSAVEAPSDNLSAQIAGGYFDCSFAGNVPCGSTAATRRESIGCVAVLTKEDYIIKGNA